jgi:single-strand DNA-binding protein
MGSYNKVVLVGRLTRDPEFRYVLEGVPLSKYTIAVDRPYKNSNGLKESDFFRIVCWRKLAELSEKYLKKGHMVLVEGCLQTQSYEKEGQRHYMTEINAENIQFMESRKTQENLISSTEEITDKELAEIPF